jgi:hypothetical protein
MASNSLQNESAQAKPLTLWDAGMRLEDIEGGAEELAALLWTAARDDQLDPEQRGALRAIGKLAQVLGGELTDLREAVYAASAAERGGNVADFPARD